MEIEPRWADDHYDRLPALAKELAARKVDVIATVGGRTTGQAARQATSTIPIVFGTGGDPVASGFVTNMARPEGNLTGVSYVVADLGPKGFNRIGHADPAHRRADEPGNPSQGHAGPGGGATPRTRAPRRHRHQRAGSRSTNCRPRRIRRRAGYPGRPLHPQRRGLHRRPVAVGVREPIPGANLLRRGRSATARASPRSIARSRPRRAHPQGRQARSSCRSSGRHFLLVINSRPRRRSASPSARPCSPAPTR